VESIRVELEVPSAAGVEAMFGKRSPGRGDSATIADGATIVYEDEIIRRGAVESAVILTFAIQVATGVTTKVLSDWLGEKLKEVRARKVRVNGQRVEITDTTGVTNAIAAARQS
jgi:hypothetical protein